jgi:hypothetical protein
MCIPGSRSLATERASRAGGYLTLTQSVAYSDGPCLGLVKFQRLVVRQETLGAKAWWFCRINLEVGFTLGYVLMTESPNFALVSPVDRGRLIGEMALKPLIRVAAKCPLT